MTIDRLKNSGIKGAHNRDAFLAELNRRGGRVESETPTAAHGISQIKYEVPRVDRTGKITHYKVMDYPKTVYDPKVFSAREMLEMAQKAAAQGYTKNRMAVRIEYTEVVNEIAFRSYIDKTTGVITNVHPK